MNELKLYSNESDLENRMIKKSLKELKVIVNTNKVHFYFSVT